MKSDFLIELELLLTRFSDLGIASDITSMNIIELWGAYRHLQQLSEE